MARAPAVKKYHVVKWFQEQRRKGKEKQRSLSVASEEKAVSSSHDLQQYPVRSRPIYNVPFMARPPVVKKYHVVKWFQEKRRREGEIRRSLPVASEDKAVPSSPEVRIFPGKNVPFMARPPVVKKYHVVKWFQEERRKGKEVQKSFSLASKEKAVPSGPGYRIDPAQCRTTDNVPSMTRAPVVEKYHVVKWFQEKRRKDRAKQRFLLKVKTEGVKSHVKQAAVLPIYQAPGSQNFRFVSDSSIAEIPGGDCTTKQDAQGQNNKMVHQAIILEASDNPVMNVLSTEQTEAADKNEIMMEAREVTDPEADSSLGTLPLFKYDTSPPFSFVSPNDFTT